MNQEANLLKPVLIDISMMLTPLKTGIYTPCGMTRVIHAYVTHYQKRARAFIQISKSCYIFSAVHSEVLFDLILNPRKKRYFFSKAYFIILTKILISKINFIQSDYRLLNGCLLFHLNHSELNFRFLKRWNIPVIYMVHDMIPLRFPEYCTKGTTIRHENLVNRLLSGHIKGVITNSHNSLIELQTYIAKKGQTNVPPMISSLLAPGLSTKRATLTRLIESPYFVVISTIEGRKNHLLLLQIWRALVEKHGDSAPKLVIIGRRGWRCRAALDLLDFCDAIQKHVIELPSCSDESLLTYLQHAQALLFPSFAEGYGLPLVEALSVQTPVIVSDLPVFHEIAGDIPEYVDPLDGKTWQRLIENYTDPNGEKRLAQLQRMKTFVWPDWHLHFMKVDEFIHRIH